MYKMSLFIDTDSTPQKTKKRRFPDLDIELSSSEKKQKTTIETLIEQFFTNENAKKIAMDVVNEMNNTPNNDEINGVQVKTKIEPQQNFRISNNETVPIFSGGIQITYFTNEQSNPKYFQKTYTISNHDNYSLLYILREIVLQKLAAVCNTDDVHIPTIYSVSKQVVNDDINMKISIKMENLVIVPKNELLQIIPDEDTWKTWYTKMETALQCLESNKLFHNDTHSENIVFYRDETNQIKLAIIDFGKASLNEPISKTSTTALIRDYEQNHNELNWDYKKWLLHDTQQTAKDYYFAQHLFYGGKCTKKTRSNRRNKRHKKRTRRQRRSSRTKILNAL